MPTLDELQAQLDVLTQRVNEITTPPDDYYTHRFSGEEIDNAVGRVAATAGSGAITAGDIGAAPGGFGLGTNCIIPVGRSANNITANGMYYCDVDTPTISDWVILHMQRDKRFAVQLAFTTNGGGLPFVRRVMNSNLAEQTWQPWEWINPPMQLGVEYRTTERHNGKPVYTKLVDCGAMPNNTLKTIEYTDDVNAMPISVTGIWDGGNTTLPSETGSSDFPAQLQNISLMNRNIVIVTHADRSSSTASATVKYWKTTD